MVLADVVLRKDRFPKSLFEVVGALINITKRNATIPSKIEKEVGKALLAFAIDPKSVILVAVNGEEPRKMSWVSSSTRRSTRRPARPWRAWRSTSSSRRSRRPAPARRSKGSGSSPGRPASWMSASRP